MANSENRIKYNTNMNTNKLKVLIVDDHPMVIKGYKICLLNNQSQYDIKVDCAHDCNDVLSLMKSQKFSFYNIVLLDISLPASNDNVIICGEDLGLLIKSNFPKIKIIVHTGLNDRQRISNIFKTLNPEGFLIKSDIESEVLSDAVNTVMKNESYYSEKTNLLIDSCRLDNVYIDSLDRKILYYLSIGEKMKNLPLYIPLSIATIERRKKNLKIFFNVTDMGDRNLLAVAKEKGFI